MKKISLLLSLFAVLGLFSCTQDEAFIEGSPSKGFTAEIPAYQFDNQTRIGISQNLSTFTWSDEDEIGIYFKNDYSNAQVGFTVECGGSSSGTFQNDAFSLKPNETYYAFYPYDPDASVDSYPIDFSGQVQTENGGTAHIGERNYMCAEVKTDASGGANIAFQNQAAVIQVVIPIEKTGNYKSLTLSTSEADFITRGTLNMKTGEITPTEKSQQMELSFGQGFEVKEGDVLVATFLVAPVNLTGKYLTIRLTERNGETVSTPTLSNKIEKGKAYRFEQGEMNEIPYLTFTASGTQTLTMTKAVETLEYSVNNGNWQELGTNTVTFGGSNGNLRLRGQSSIGTAIAYNNCSRISFGNDTEVACSGDIRTLVDYRNYQTTDTSNARFCRLFNYCTSLIQSPTLPATALASYCYYGMFWDCINLTQAPDLPATTLASSCYYYMFSGCTGLTKGPLLPATTLASGCYSYMFSGCTGLTHAPNLPATNLALRCYSSMLSGTNLLPDLTNISFNVETATAGWQGLFAGTKITDDDLKKILPLNQDGKPYLPPTTLTDDCYEAMFYGCTCLTIAPELPATTLADNCYSEMFSGCTGLTQAPELPAPALADYCYHSMFSRCIALTQAPELPATTLAPGCYHHMFDRCTGLTQAPELPALILARECYCAMFANCSNLMQAPVLSATILEQNCYGWMFSRCSKLNYIKMMATDISASGCFDYWTDGVSSTGTFVKNSAAKWSNDGVIPSGWNVKTESEKGNGSGIIMPGNEHEG